MSDIEDEEMPEVEEENAEIPAEIVLVDKDKPKFVLVEVSRLEKLLQRCPECGKLPGHSRHGPHRVITWTKNGIQYTFESCKTF